MGNVPSFSMINPEYLEKRLWIMDPVPDIFHILDKVKQVEVWKMRAQYFKEVQALESEFKQKLMRVQNAYVDKVTKIVG